MKVAVVSDIHSNLEALQAVLADIYKQKIGVVYCLGDVIGYGPQPIECLEIAYDFRFNLMGNHEEAVLFGAVGFNPKAKAAIDWTRDQLNGAGSDLDVKRERWNFIGEMKERYDEGDLCFVHGSPREPTREYVFHTDVLDREKVDDIFERFDRACFVGHTHTPGVITDDYRFLHPRDIGSRYAIGKGKCLINTGSVGQPRDGDPRASYITIDDGVVEWRRIEYDVEKTVSAVLDTRELPPYLGLRLREGH
ncbi:MAG: metallophosphoesterase [Planctomycetes bacterium]|nr:metallophosphoesterase [Planctomycetota bacterium]